MAACKLEAPGLMRKCANFILAPSTQLSVFARLSLLDRCFLHELLDTCLKAVSRPEHANDMTLQQTCEQLIDLTQLVLMLYLFYTVVVVAGQKNSDNHFQI